MSTCSHRCLSARARGPLTRPGLRRSREGRGAPHHEKRGREDDVTRVRVGGAGDGLAALGERLLRKVGECKRHGPAQPREPQHVLVRLRYSPALGGREDVADGGDGVDVGGSRDGERDEAKHDERPRPPDLARLHAPRAPYLDTHTIRAGAQIAHGGMAACRMCRQGCAANTVMPVGGTETRARGCIRCSHMLSRGG